MKLLYCTFFYVLLSLTVAKHNVKVFVVVDPSKHDANYISFLDSTRYHKIEVTELDASHDCHKYELLHSALEPYSHDPETVILYSASQDVVFAKPLDAIVEAFKESDARILFAGDNECLPNPKLAESFSLVKADGLKYLNSDLIMGYARDLYELTEEVTDDIDQLYFTKKYLNRDEVSQIKIDHFAEVFQILAFNMSVTLDYDSDQSVYVVKNELHWTQPSVLLARDSTGHVMLNRFNDYINGARDNTTCLTCLAHNVTYTEDEYPTITMAVFIFYRTPFLEDYLEKIANLNYPKSKISVIMASTFKIHEKTIAEFKKKYAKEYAKFKYMGHEYNYSQLKLLQIGMKFAVQRKTEYYFVTDSAVHLDYNNTLLELVELNKDFVAPILKRPTTIWSNFWGELDPRGFYKRSFDYVSIVENQIRGVWNVPYVAHCYLLHISVVPLIQYEFAGNWYGLGKDFMDDPEMTLCNNARREVS